MTTGDGKPELAHDGADVVVGRPDLEGQRTCELCLRVAGPPAEAQSALDRVLRYAVGTEGLASPTLVAATDEQRLAFRIRGTTLDELIAAGPTDPHRVVDLIGQLATTLGFLHDQGIAHGHVRSDLIWVDERLHVGGLGAAQVALALGNAADAAKALPLRYRAPELRGRGPGRPETWSDVFVVGVLAAELLAGQRAVGGLPSSGISEAVDQLLGRATADSSSARPRSLGAWARVLADAIRATPVAEVRPESAAVGASNAASSPLRVFVPPPSSVAGHTEPTVSPDSGRVRARDFRPALDEISHHPEGPPPPPSSRISVLPGPPGRGAVGMVLLVVGGLLVMLAGVTVTFLLALQTGRSGGSVTTSGPSGGQGGEGGTIVGAPAPSLLPPPSAEAPVPARPAPLLPDRGPATTPASHQRAPIPIDATTPVLGSPVAPVTVVVFGDLGEFRSLQLVHRLHRLALERGPDVRLAWRHQPRNDHLTATVWTGAGVQLDHGSRAFWVFAEALAGQSEPADEVGLRRALRLAGGADGSVERWGKAPEVVNQLEADRMLSVLFNVRGVPTVFVNGVRLEGAKLEELPRYIDTERRAGTALLADGVAAADIYPTRVLKNLAGVGKDLPERRCPTLQDAPWRGSEQPVVTVVELGDFECTSCARARPVLDRLVGGEASDVRHVWKDFPLRQHRHARAAAALGRAAFLAGGNEGFWRVHQELFATQKPLEDTELSRIARAVGLEEGAVMSAVRDGLHDAALDAQLEEATRLGARGIPTFFVNGIRVDGGASTELAQVVAQERERAARLLAAGVQRARLYEALCGTR